MDENFFDEDKPLDQVTMSELDDLAKKIFIQRGISDEWEDVLRESNKNLESLQLKMASILEKFGRTNYEVPGVGRLNLVERSYVGLPKTPEEKEAFYAYLKEKGVFNELITVNSNTLNSFYKREKEIAIEEGRSVEFSIPGIKPPSTSTIVRITKGK